ncbi:MAG TPA: APC family permease [Vicinamibacterales bacterium]|jgi:APA family basic amino acid/polyamine antiporter|nr:APC family permease [Vicinamibacterales bacterium]
MPATSVRPRPAESAAGRPELRRALGRWDLTAIGINQVIGGAIFLTGAQVAAQIGTWSPVGFALAGLASLTVALCFAEVGSRFDGTGGPYLYTRAAFGRFAAFEVGWMQWFTRAASQASIMAGIALALGYYWPSVTAGWPRAALLTGVTAGLTFVNVRGIRQSAWLVNALTIGKLVPLAIFIAAGAFFVEPARFLPLPPVSSAQVSTAALLLIFVYGGYDVIPVPAGEAIDPRRHVPFALVMTILIVMGVMTAAQVVAQGILPNLGAHATPIADAAAVFLGPAGALLIGVGSVVSMTGNNAGQILSGSRMLFALAEHGELPAFFGRIHPLYRTPANAVVFTSAVALALGLSGSFAQLALVSALARLVTYTAASASTLRLRVIEARPATFIVPGGPVIPWLAILISAGVVLGATRAQLLGGTAALVVGALLFAVNARSVPRTETV